MVNKFSVGDCIEWTEGNSQPLGRRARVIELVPEGVRVCWEDNGYQPDGWYYSWRFKPSKEYGPW